ncbi:hypothetical protein [Pseudochryseolinea flava]|uniref:Universal stress protein n=1 Tax=Pseudochryseolinea flava TaxID=2059302 RepID=A0A364Y1E0_9BACT|nr:hypothetical protein [Pseudochryseolinea flava]RAW00661.1 hypothetical protein DQQ10_13815 [Pseudochryseolinea flava]
MRKTILIPTDCSIYSLQVVKHAIDRNADCVVDVVLFTGVFLSNNISNMLFFSKEELVDELCSEEFHEACEIICNKYGKRVRSMRFEIFTGNTQAAFENFLLGNDVDEMFIPHARLVYGKKCFDPVPYMQDSKLPSTVISLVEERSPWGDNILSELFYNLNKAR